MVSGRDAPHCKSALYLLALSRLTNHLRMTGQFASRLDVLSSPVWVASMVLVAVLVFCFSGLFPWVQRSFSGFLSPLARFLTRPVSRLYGFSRAILPGCTLARVSRWAHRRLSPSSSFGPLLGNPSTSSQSWDFPRTLIGAGGSFAAAGKWPWSWPAAGLCRPWRSSSLYYRAMWGLVGNWGPGLPRQAAWQL